MDYCCFIKSIYKKKRSELQLKKKIFLFVIGKKIVVILLNNTICFTELLDNLRPVSPKPGHLERVKTPQGNSSSGTDDLQAYRERFLKINVRHITDGQVL